MSIYVQGIGEILKEKALNGKTEYQYENIKNHTTYEVKNFVLILAIILHKKGYLLCYSYQYEVKTMTNTGYLAFIYLQL